jgi:hypothetical protein
MDKEQRIKDLELQNETSSNNYDDLFDKHRLLTRNLKKVEQDNKTLRAYCIALNDELKKTGMTEEEIAKVALDKTREIESSNKFDKNLVMSDARHENCEPSTNKRT